MRIDYGLARDLADCFGDAFYIFDQILLEKNYADIYSEFNNHYKNTKIAYSYKTNYIPLVCKVVDSLGGYAEVVSEMEFRLALRLGVDSNRIIYNGPYKSIESTRDSLLQGCIVNLDSIRDINLLDQIASENPLNIMRIGLRCNFQLSEESTSRFGLDISGDEFRHALKVIEKHQNVSFSGIHCHFPDRSLLSFKQRARRMVEISNDIFDEPPDFIDIGGGFFGELPHSLSQLYREPIPSIADYAGAVGNIFSAHFQSCSKKPVLFIEPGTAIVASTMSFVTRVINIKFIKDKKYIFVAGSIFNISPIARSLNLPVNILSANSGNVVKKSNEVFDVVGYTCIEGDYLSKNLSGLVEINDFLEYGNVGSYSIVMKPPFILPNVPILLQGNSVEECIIIKKAESLCYPFENFV